MPSGTSGTGARSRAPTSEGARPEPSVDPPHDEGLAPAAWPQPPMALLEGAAPDVARGLLGMLLVRALPDGTAVARIVETEAYAGPEDRASHARAGLTRRTRVMFGPAGRAYVYLVYGMHHCLNVVCGPDGRAGAVLIRAAEPLLGIDGMRRRRGDPAGPDARLAAGPARLCQALAIDRGLDGADLLGDGRLRLVRPEITDGMEPRPDGAIVAGPRVGVAYAGEEWAARPWRFGLAGHPSLSRPFPGPA